MKKLSAFALTVFSLSLFLVGAPSVDAATVTNAYDQPSTLLAGTVSNHKFVIDVASGVDEGDTLTLTFPSEFDTSSINEDDVDIDDDGIDLTTAADCTGSEEASVAMAADALTITICSGDGGAIVAGSSVSIEIGANAGASGSGLNRITNPSVEKSYFVSIGGTFGDTGTIVVPIINPGSAGITATVPVTGGGGGGSEPPPTPTYTINITQPNGGEEYDDGDSVQITWSYSSGISFVNLYYSIDNGSSYNTITSGISNSGNYYWTVPDEDTTEALIRIEGTDLSTVLDSDVSDSTFTIHGTIESDVAVTSPNGGETYASGDTQNITWTNTSDIDLIDIFLSTDDGVTFNSVAADIDASLGTYEWTVPVADTTTAFVRVDGKDGTTLLDFDTSDAAFSIEEPFETMVSITSPNGGESLTAEEVEVITWGTSDDIIVVDLYYSIDNGDAWTLIESGLDNSGSYDWLVPLALTDQALIRLDGYDEASAITTDQSDGAFSVIEPDEPEPPEPPVDPPTPPVDPPSPPTPVPDPTPPTGGDGVATSTPEPTPEDEEVERSLAVELVVSEGKQIITPIGKSFDVLRGTEGFVRLIIPDSESLASGKLLYGGRTYELLNPVNDMFEIDFSFGDSDEAMAIKLIYNDQEEVDEKYAIRPKDLGQAVIETEEGDQPVAGAVIIVYSLDGGQRTQWQADDFAQENPIITGPEGAFGWYVPNGSYVVTAGSSEYEDVEQAVFVNNNILNPTIALASVSEEPIIEPEEPVEPEEPEEPVEEPTEPEQPTSTVTQTVRAVTDGVSRATEAVVQSVEAVREVPEVQTAATVATPVAVASAIGGTTVLASSFSFLPFLQYLLTAPILFLARRRRQKFGLVYNAFTKIPVDLAIVRLYTAAGKLVRTMVTDQEGRYYFKANPGEYKIQVTKQGFTFPSESLQGMKEDGKLVDIYTGGIIKVTEDSAIIAANIPVEPITAEEVATSRSMVIKRFLRVLQRLVGFAGVILAFFVWLIQPSVFAFILFVVQIAILSATLYLIRPKKKKGWGIVYQDKKTNPIKNAIVRLYEPKYNKLLETTITDAKGRYAFLAGANEYFVTYDKPGFEKKEVRPIDYSDKEEPEFISVDVQLKKLAV